MNENIIILLIYVFLVAGELYAPKRENVNVELRWPANYLLSFLTLAIVVLLSYFFGLSEVDVVDIAATSDYFYPLKAILMFLSLDLLMYVLHRIAHGLTILWRFHRVHHSDPSFDLSTNFRHHPIELLWATLVISQIVSLIQLDIMVVSAYTLVATLTQMWHHSNIKLPEKIERKLSVFFISPSLHIIHHSLNYNESNRNFGTVFTLWDRLFSTFQMSCYCNHPEEVGVKGFNGDGEQSLSALLNQPFQNKPK